MNGHFSPHYCCLCASLTLALMVSHLLSPLTSCSPILPLVFHPPQISFSVQSHILSISSVSHWLNIAAHSPTPQSLSLRHCSVSNGPAPSQQFYQVDAGPASALTNASQRQPLSRLTASQSCRTCAQMYIAQTRCSRWEVDGKINV